MYKYENVELTPAVFKELLIELFDGKQFKRADAIKIITEHHRQNGGKLNKNEYASVFKKATQMLNGQGLVNNAYGVWTLNYENPEIEVFEIEEPTVKISADEEFGTGKNAVYVYYFDVYKELAKLHKQNNYPCKIGRTDRDPLQRIINQSGTCYPELPHIALIFYCDNSSYLENAFHSILKIKGRWIENAPGAEWFETNVDEIKEIYTSIINK